MGSTTRNALALAVIVGAGLWAYSNSLAGPFIFDDVHAIVDNPHVRRLWPLTFALEAPYGSTVAARPVVALSLALNYAAGGLAVRGYHVFNLGVHLLCAVALFGLARRTLLQPRMRGVYGASSSWLAMSIALLWAVHPLLTEAVDYTIQRTELLMALCYLLTLYCAARAIEPGASPRWKAASAAACYLGMGSKEVMVTAPIAVFLYDCAFQTMPVRELWRRRRGLYLGLASSWLLLIGLVATHPRPAAGFEFDHLTSPQYAMTQLGVIAHYIRLAVWPAPLVVDYGDWPVARALEHIPPAGWLVGALALSIGWGLLRRSPAAFAGAWALLVLAPTSSIMPIPTEIAAERRMYLPLAAVISVGVIAAWRLLPRLVAAAPARRFLGAATVAGLVAVLITMTVRRNADYRTALGLWQDAVAKRPSNARAHNNLGFILSEAGRYEPAASAYQEALRLRPDYYKAHSNLCYVFGEQGKPNQARPHCERALAMRPGDSEVQNNAGLALLREGRLEESIIRFREAVRLRPEFAKAHNNLGGALATTGRLQEAVGHFALAQEMNPSLPGIQQNLRQAQAELQASGKGR